MTNLAGTPGVVGSISELGSIPSNSVKGIICLQGILKRGKAGKNYLITTENELRRYCGGLHNEDDFNLQVKQAIKSGAKVRVTRAFHYTDIDDIATVDGSTATGSLSNNAVASVSAKGELTINTWTGTGSNLTITVLDIATGGTIAIANYNGTASQTPTAAATAVFNAINAGTGSHGYSSTNPSAGKIIINAPTTLGSLLNGKSITTSVTAGTISASTTFSGGLYVGAAYASFQIATWTGSGSNLTITSPSLVTSGTTDTIVSYDGLTSQSVSAANIAIVAAINAGTGSHLYEAVVIGSAIYVFKQSGTGAEGNGNLASVVITAGTLTALALKYKGGVTAYGALGLNVSAEAVGDGYDGTTIEITPSASNIADQVDIKITLKDTDLPQEIKGVSRVLDNVKLISLNKQMEGVSFSGLTGFTLPVGTVTLSGGLQDISDITDVDFNGSSISKTGWYAFDDVVDSMRIWNISRRTHEANQGLALYCAGRKDMRGRGFAPHGLTIQGYNDFRDGEGMYTHTPIDTFYFSLWYGELFITDPNNNLVKDYSIGGGGFQAGNRAVVDNLRGEWISDSGEQYGKILGSNGVALNFGSPGNKKQYDSLYEKGFNAIINDPKFKVVSWGNRTTLLDTTSLLSKDNIADLVVYIGRETHAIARKMNFKPNDIQMFSELYRRVLPFIKDTLVSGRAIEGDAGTSRGEGVWWHWLGDQFAKNLNDLKINQKSEVDAGKYRVRFAFKPIAANEYIGLDLAPADSETILNVAILTNLSA